MTRPSRSRSKPSSQRTRFQRRYAGGWPTIAAKTRQLALDRCILNPFHKAEAVHHLRYRDIRGKIAGREIPGWDVVPLCRRCHGIVHRQQYWYRDKRNPASNNRQRWFVLWGLRLRFWAWVVVSRIWWIVVLGLAPVIWWVLTGS
ncbi:MAG: hypothetical protein J7642_11100 [Cyanobacteria bacterium SBC]|nr:hypothetical protein [Cyanobacteria bacterium SBC]